MKKQDLQAVLQFIKKLSFLSNYSWLILPGVLLFAAILFLVAGSIVGGSLKSDMARQSIASLGTKVKRFIKTAPSKKQWQVEREYQQARSEDAAAITALVRQSHGRKLLSDKIFPEPTDKSTLIFTGFGRKYQQAINKLIDLVKGSDCPAEREIETSLARTGPAADTGQSQVASTITDLLCIEKAKSAGLYINPYDIAGYAFWDDYEYIGADKAIADCWYWQLGYWIIEDVIETASAMNAGYENILESPLKRLISIEFGGSAAEPPGYITNGGSLAQSFTDRLTSDIFDVVHFKLRAVADAAGVFGFMDELCSSKRSGYKDEPAEPKPQMENLKRNQITILRSNITAVVRDDDEHLLYRYGQNAVVEVELVCEYIFDRAGHKPIKPAAIAKLFEPNKPATRGRSRRN